MAEVLCGIFWMSAKVRIGKKVRLRDKGTLPRMLTGNSRIPACASPQSYESMQHCLVVLNKVCSNEGPGFKGGPAPRGS